jgi:hypothetical protein
MRKQEIEFRDPVVQSVVNKFVDRSNVGYVKYGKTMRDDKSDVFVWLNHLQEELLDASLYLQRLKEEISTLREEKALLNEINDIDVIDAFEVPSKKKIKSKKIKPGRGDHYTFTIDEYSGSTGSPIGKYISNTTDSHFKLRHPEDND